MTKEEFQSLVQEYKGKGFSDEDIAIVFGKMFQDDALDREQYEACLNAIGYELSDELKQMPDDELKEKVIVKPDEGKGDDDKKGDPEGKEPPAADEHHEKPEEKPEEKHEEKIEEKEEVETESKSGDDEEEEEAMKLFGIRK